MTKKAVLLVNLGSPDSPSVPDVRRYLREFLMDGRVMDAPWPIRAAVVNFAILPKRPHASAEAYRSVWTKEGAPLIVMSRKIQSALQTRLAIPVELAMRYQNPSIHAVVESLSLRDIDELLLIPLFPQYAMSSYETAVERVKKAVREITPSTTLHIQPPYYERPDYIEALAASASAWLNQPFDHLLFSFHGLPERHLKKADPTCSHCLKAKDCCITPSPAHATCYRAQCLATVRAFVAKTGVPGEKYSVAFQSRLGRDPWLQPYTDREIVRLASEGIKRLLVICPAFVSDCLETLEEIGMRASESFRLAGGNELRLIPCLNNHPKWIETVQRMVTERWPQTMADQVKTALSTRCLLEN